MKDSLEEILADKHDLKQLNAYLKALQEIENVDFSVEIKKTKEKIDLINRVTSVLEHDKKSKLAIEDLEKL